MPMRKPKSIRLLKDVSEIVAVVEGKRQKFDMTTELPLQVPNDDLSEALERIPGQYWFWGTTLVKAQERLRRMEQELEELRAVRFHDYLNIYIERGRTWTTEGIKAEVTNDQSVMNMRKEVRKAKASVDLLFTVRRALEIQKECLMSRGRRLRDEEFVTGRAHIKTKREALGNG